MAQLEARVKDCEEKIAELMRKEKTVVAFSAATEFGGAFGPFDEDKTVVYNMPTTNISNAYNTSTGVFTAPVAGVYCFAFFFRAEGDNAAKLVLVKDGHKIVATSDDRCRNDTADNGGNAAIVELKKDSEVYVRLVAGTHVWAGGQYTTFSGFLLHQN
ncbi:complement C1q-like protein 4 [Lates calcarifer]|uniref:Complement C1q-like protein 4 n=1 Tax=Lates calcarifer TaxID=8187 RepID=A0AAJ7Q0A9_LATCA|nr:complement C1q-like protein 4 [Lates calcarifer]